MHLDDFVTIKGHLDAQLVGVDAEIAIGEQDVAALRARFETHLMHVHELEGERSQLHAEISTLESVLAQQQMDAQLARGTSLEEEQSKGVQATEEQIRLCRAEIAAREARIGDNHEAQRECQSEMQACAQVLAALQKRRRELEASRRRFDGEHLRQALPVCLEPLASIHQRIVSLEAELEEAKRERLVAQEEAARQLAAWPVEGAAALAQHGCFADDPNTQFLKLYHSLMEFCETHMRELSGHAREELERSDLPFLKFLAWRGSRQSYFESVQRRYELAAAHPRSDPRMIDRAQFLDATYEHFLRWIAQLENDIAEQKRHNQETQARQLVTQAQAEHVAQAEAERLQVEADVATSSAEPELVAPKASKRQKTKK